MKIKKVNAFRYAPVFFLIAFSLLYGLSSYAGTAGGVKKTRVRYDEVEKATEYYRLKRAPVGQVEVPAERYLAAAEEVKLMPRYSSLTSSFAPSRWAPGHS
jgi:hypothetical protein